jgi:hypothetical protein
MNCIYTEAITTAVKPLKSLQARYNGCLTRAISRDGVRSLLFVILANDLLFSTRRAIGCTTTSCTMDTTTDPLSPFGGTFGIGPANRLPSVLASRKSPCVSDSMDGTMDGTDIASEAGDHSFRTSSSAWWLSSFDAFIGSVLDLVRLAFKNCGPGSYNVRVLPFASILISDSRSNRKTSTGHSALVYGFNSDISIL